METRTVGFEPTRPGPHDVFFLEDDKWEARLNKELGLPPEKKSIFIGSAEWVDMAAIKMAVKKRKQ